jgi:hypothetical protein
LEFFIKGGPVNNYRKILPWCGISLFIIVCAALVWNCGDKGTNPPTTLQDLFLTTQITGWVPDSSSHFKQNPPNGLYGPINGAAPAYIDSGVVSWFSEKMYGGPTATSAGGEYVFIGYIMDFGTTKNAKALYGAKIAANFTPYPNDKVTLGQYSDNEAQAITNGGGVTVAATFGKYYFEFPVMGFSVTADAVTEALKFLDKYKATVR